MALSASKLITNKHIKGVDLDDTSRYTINIANTKGLQMKYESAPNGYSIYLKEKGHVFMQKGYVEIICSDEDMLNGNIEYMTEMGLSRNEPK